MAKAAVAQAAPPVAPATRLDVPGLDEAAKAVVEARLVQEGGTLLSECGAKLAESFGKFKDIERQKAAVKSPVPSREEQDRVAALNAQLRNREFRTHEIARWTEAVKQYLIKTYGAAVKDGLGYETGFGERIALNRQNGHYRRLW